MKKLKLFLLFLIPGISIIVAKTEIKSWNNLKKSIEDYEILIQNNPPLSEEALTWVPESGVRGKYYSLKKFVGISALEKISGEKVFRSGPHEKELNLSSMTGFGYYNRRFLMSLKIQLEKIINDENFSNISGRVYTTHFKKMLRVYYSAYHFYKSFPERSKIKVEYMKKINDFPGCKLNPSYLCNPSNFLEKNFSDFANRVEKQGYDLYEAISAPGFWVRRSIDGTSDIFYELILMALKKFDSSFLYE